MIFRQYKSLKFITSFAKFQFSKSSKKLQKPSIKNVLNNAQQRVFTKLGLKNLKQKKKPKQPEQATRIDLTMLGRMKKSPTRGQIKMQKLQQSVYQQMFRTFEEEIPPEIQQQINIQKQKKIQKQAQQENQKTQQQLKKKFHQKQLQMKLKKPAGNRYNNQTNLLSKLKQVQDERNVQHPIGTLVQKFHQRRIDSINEKNRRSNYQFYEYARGQEGIELFPIRSQLAYTYQKLFKQAKSKADFLKKMKNPRFRDAPNANARLLRQYKKKFMDQYKLHEFQQFDRLIASYPGSRKGPHPRDDKQNFLKYLKGRIPVSILKKFPKYFKVPKLQSTPSVLSIFTHPNVSEDVFTSNRDLENIQEKEDHATYVDSKYILQGYCPVPVMPDLPYISYQQNWAVILKWSTFRSYFIWSNVTATAINNLKLIVESLKNENHAVKIGSLYSYYKTLPDWIQQHQGIKDIYLGLQYSTPRYTIYQKQRALNYAAYLLLPFDEITQDIIQQHIQNPKHIPTPYELNKALTMKPEFTFQIEQFMKQLHEQKLRGESKVQEKQQQQFISPPSYNYKNFEISAPNLPIDYYDNDDGFWDDYKVLKMKKYDEVPIFRHRPYLKH